jgi:Protein of unknown function (DUF2628)
VTDPSSPGAAPSGDGNAGSGAPDPNLPAWARRQQGANPMTEARLAAFIGPRWEVYQRKFAPFFEEPAFVPTWNWSAALFQSAWFLYRKLYLAAFAFMLGPGLVFRLLTGSDAQLTMTELQKPENEGLLLMQLAVGVSSIITSGGVANWLLFRRARAAVRLAALQSMPEGETLPWLERVGGINRLGVALAAAVFVMSLYATVRA